MEAKAKGGKRSRTNGGSGTTTMDRKEVERERRQHMKELCAQLVSLIPKEHCPSTDTLTLLGSLDEATTYINKLKDRVDELHQRRSSAQAEARLRGGAGSRVSTLMNCGTGSELESVKAGKASVAPVVEVRHHIDSSMEVLLICSTERLIKLHEVITILEEEGAEVVNANHSVAGHKIFYTIHSRDTLTLLGSLDEATTYINKLKDRVDELHQRRSSAQAEVRLRGGAGSRVLTLMNCGTGSELESVKAGKASVAPVVEVRHHIDSSMEVLLICFFR